MENYGNSNFRVVKENGEYFLQHLYKGEVCDTMKIYGIDSKPYIKRLGSKTHLANFMIEQLKALNGENKNDK